MKTILITLFLISVSLCNTGQGVCVSWGRGNLCEGYANLDLVNSMNYNSRNNFYSTLDLITFIVDNEKNREDITGEIDKLFETPLADILAPFTYEQVKQMNDWAQDLSIPDGDMNNFKSTMQYNANKPCLVASASSCQLYQNNGDNTSFCPINLASGKVYQLSNGRCELKSSRNMYKNPACHTYTAMNQSGNMGTTSRSRGTPKFLRRSAAPRNSYSSQRNGLICLKCRHGYAILDGQCVETKFEGCLSVDARGNCTKCDLASGFVDSTNNRGCWGFIKYKMNGRELRATINQ